MNNDQSGYFFFPFIGVLEGGDIFQYLLKDIREDRAEIAIVNWLVSRTILNKGDKISFYIPCQSSIFKQLVRNVTGIITSSEKDDKIQGIVYQISFIKEDHEPPDKIEPLHEFIQNLKITSSLSQMMKVFVKDSMILKEGMTIYLKHLIPFFSRIVNLEYKEYLKIKENLLLDILNKVKNNLAKLTKLHETLEKVNKDEDLPIFISLEEIREIIESEVSSDLFEIVFSEQNDLTSKTRIQSNYSVSTYVDAIKNLEKRIYANFNSIVILYLKSLSIISLEGKTIEKIDKSRLKDLASNSLPYSPETR